MRRFIPLFLTILTTTNLITFKYRGDWSYSKGLEHSTKVNDVILERYLNSFTAVSNDFSICLSEKKKLNIIIDNIRDNRSDCAKEVANCESKLEDYYGRDKVCPEKEKNHQETVDRVNGHWGDSISDSLEYEYEYD